MKTIKDHNGFIVIPATCPEYSRRKAGIQKNKISGFPGRHEPTARAGRIKCGMTDINFIDLMPE
jgi:hypothetical protein